MPPKIKSSIFLLGFVISALFCYQIEESEENESTIKNSNIVSIEMTQLDSGEDLTTTQDVLLEEN
tara:strand:+ start:18436 stop:18630 length:195 start_codon:yes stop_codon:yes gene_type:complete